MSIEDWWKGYRQLFPTREHAGLAVIAIQCPASGDWFYSQLYGFPFGLGSAVNQFSRAAAFVTAVNRRLLYLLTGNYVDDSAPLEMSPIAFLDGSAARTAKASAEYAGVLYSPSKYQPPPSCLNSWVIYMTGAGLFIPHALFGLLSLRLAIT